MKPVPLEIEGVNFFGHTGMLVRREGEPTRFFSLDDDDVGWQLRAYFAALVILGDVDDDAA